MCGTTGTPQQQHFVMSLLDLDVNDTLPTAESATDEPSTAAAAEAEPLVPVEQAVVVDNDASGGAEAAAAVCFEPFLLDFFCCCCFLVRCARDCSADAPMLQPSESVSDTPEPAVSAMTPLLPLPFC